MSVQDFPSPSDSIVIIPKNAERNPKLKMTYWKHPGSSVDLNNTYVN